MLTLRKALVLSAIFSSVLFSVTVSADEAFPSRLCTGRPLTYEAAIRLLPPGKNSVLLGRFDYVVKARECSALSGCTVWKELRDSIGYHYLGPWTDGHGNVEMKAFYEWSTGVTGGTFFIDADSRGASLHFVSREMKGYFVTDRGIRWESRVVTDQLSDFFRDNGGNLSGVVGRFDITKSAASAAHFAGRDQGVFDLTANCASFRSKVVRAGGSETWTEYQFVALGRY